MSGEYFCVMPNSYPRTSSACAVKLIQDISKLLNNRQGSDVQFLVGGGTTDSDSSATEITYNASATVTMYAHSAILLCRSRHFASMFENEKEWRECSDRVIYKPNISPSVFHKILEYIYTGDTNAQTDILVELITAAEEMELEELSIECQANVMKVLEQAFLSKGAHIYEDIKSQQPNQQDLPLPISIAISKILLPALSLAHSRNMSDFFQQLHCLISNHIKIIFDSPYARIIFFKGISTQVLRQILASDELQMQEYDVWNLAFSIACHKSNVMQPAVEAYFKLENRNSSVSKFVSKIIDDKGSFEQQALISEEQLKQFKDNLTPWLPAIRFSLIEGDQYSRIVEILNYVLPPRRSFELQKFYAQSDSSKLLDLPRLIKRPSALKNEESNGTSKNINKKNLLQSKAPLTVNVSLLDIMHSLPPTLKTETLQPSPLPLKVEPRPKTETLFPSPPLLRPEVAKPPTLKPDILSENSRIIDRESWLRIMTWIVESNGLAGCRSAGSVRFNLLFRASEHNFLASAFHTHCDNKGPTLVVIESQDGHKFGGVNFAHWQSVKSWSGTTSNFIFALEDGRHREIAALFLYRGTTNEISAARNDAKYGPRFGGNDIIINGGPTKSSSCIDSYNNGNVGKSSTPLSGTRTFFLKDYEVFKISVSSSYL